jgi:hypothetical protein
VTVDYVYDSDNAPPSALDLASCEMVFIARKRIRPIYLLDAALELVLAGFEVRRLFKCRP